MELLGALIHFLKTDLIYGAGVETHKNVQHKTLPSHERRPRRRRGRSVQRDAAATAVTTTIPLWRRRTSAAAATAAGIPKHTVAPKPVPAPDHPPLLHLLPASCPAAAAAALLAAYVVHVRPCVDLLQYVSHNTRTHTRRTSTPKSNQTTESTHIHTPDGLPRTNSNNRINTTKPKKTITSSS